MNLKFVRQHPIPYEIDGKLNVFVTDFYCASNKLIIELDGSSHIDSKEKDEIRDNILTKKGYKVIHFFNRDIEKDLPKTIEKLISHLKLNS